MSVKEKIKMPNKELVQPKKMGLLVEIQSINLSGTHGAMMLG